MALRLLPNLFVVALLLDVCVGAQQPGWTDEFRASGTNGTVRALCTFDDGTGEALYLAGEFTRAADVAANRIARWDGIAVTTLGAGLDGVATCALAFDDGSGPALYVGGAFSQAGGQNAANIARWNGTSWSGVGAGFDDVVLALAAHDDGSGPKLYAGGSFTQSGSVTARRLARWDGASWSEVGGGVNAPVDALCSWNPGTGAVLVAGGEMTQAGATAANYIASWNGTNWSALGTGVSNAVLSLGTFDDGSGLQLIVGGDFWQAGGVSAFNIARWDGTSWSAMGAPAGGAVRAIHVHPIQGVPRLMVAGDGPLLFMGGGNWLQLPGGSRSTYALASYAENGSQPKLFCGGGFIDGGGGESRGIARFDGSSWTGIDRAGGLGSPAYETLALVEHEDGSGRALIASSSFSSASPTGVHYVARWTGSDWLQVGSPPISFATLASFDSGSGKQLYGSGFNVIRRWNGTSFPMFATSNSGLILVLAALDAGNGMRLFAAGRFSELNGVPFSNIAQFDGTNWSAVGAGLGVQNLTQVVNALVVFDDGTGPALYAGGNFLLAGSTRQVARFDGATWTALPPLRNVVRSLAVFDDGTGPALYAGGGLDPFAGGTAGSFVERWHGSTWTDLTPSWSVTFTNVRSLCVYDDGSGPGLYVGGRFTAIEGVPASNLARWNGTQWSGVSGGLTMPAGLTSEPCEVTTLSVFDAGDGRGPGLFVGGRFMSSGNLEARNVARWQGARITSFCAGDGVDAAVTTPCPCGNLGAPGHGCAWHTGPDGALLAAHGRIAPVDELVLEATGMALAAPSTIFLKGDALVAGGVVFGDGVRCAGGNLIRLGTKTNVNGAARFPEPGNPPVSVRGATPPGSGMVGYYQTYFRNAASFCTPATFNVTNGIRVVW